MDYAIDTMLQLRIALRDLRKRSYLNQTEAGKLIGVSQRRITQIEADPMRTSFDQLSRLVAAYGGHFLIAPPVAGLLSEPPPPPYGTSPASKPKRKTKADKIRESIENANW
ncbi:MAG: helix-turn-helix domain-containing protein [Puniceicoccales bacterium]|nr:helix-turn-helix domain-containing protein [Puniceicoccales bacterium]